MYLRPNGQQIIDSRSDDQLCFPNGQENNELDNFYKHNFLNTNNFFNFYFKKNMNGKVLDLPFFSVFPLFVYS